MNPGKPLAAEVRYELCIVQVPPNGMDFCTSSQRLTIEGGGPEGHPVDAAAIRQVTLMNGRIMHEKVVAILGSTEFPSPRNFLELREFLLGGGVIGIDKDLGG